MSINMGTVDRGIRAVVGLLLIVLPFVTSWALFSTTWVVYASVVIGLVMLGTAAVGNCPMYRIFGIKTCKL
ncbi:DUF2892 domain-containing protein [Pararhodobacter sp.]|uniref:YgaP family membrane protein n=1 Tax=Pararhodobacter sp. TaxID=2127056 RepID=UPI002AFF331B|nr:DUF2892 domain-containing protein [Pararhodobacter sp.]